MNKSISFLVDRPATVRVSASIFERHISAQVLGVVIEGNQQSIVERT